jgi:hypothetical protein
VLVNNTDGDEYAQDTITVIIDNPADIDDKDIICSWENGRFSDTITLVFKVYVPDKLDNSQDCDRCEDGVQSKLKRATVQKTEDVNLDEKITHKVMRKYNVSEVSIDSNGNICVCKPPPRTTTMDVSLFIIVFLVSILLLLLIYYCYSSFVRKIFALLEKVLKDSLRVPHSDGEFIQVVAGGHESQTQLTSSKAGSLKFRDQVRGVADASSFMP